MPEHPTIPTVHGRKGTIPLIGSLGGSATYNPATDSRLVGWYNESSVVLTDDVDAWNDATSHNNDLTTVLGVGDLKPHYLLEDSEINNHNCVEFAAQGEALRRTSAPSGITNAATIAIVSRKNAISQGGFYAQGFGTGNHHPFSDGVVYDGFFSTTRQTAGTPSPATEGTYHIWIIHAENNNYRIEIDGVQLFATATYTFDAGNRFTLGCGSDNGTVIGFSLAGRIAEIHLFNTVLSATDRGAVRTYLETRFAL